MPDRRYPSKNTIRLQADLERLAGGRVEWDRRDNGVCFELDLTCGDYEWGPQRIAHADGGSAASLDAAKRLLLVQALEDTRKRLSAEEGS